MPALSYLITKPSRFGPHLQRVDDVDEFDPQTWVDMPLLGTITAGRPIDLFRTEDSIKVPPAVIRKESYALRVVGNSMIDEHIQDGDIIVVKSQTHADNGQVVVALINGEQTTLKKFYIEADGIRLQPANPEHSPIRLRHDQVQILGIVQCILRQPS